MRRAEDERGERDGHDDDKWVFSLLLHSSDIDRGG